MKLIATILILSLSQLAYGQPNLSMSYSHKAHFQLEAAQVHRGTGILLAAGLASNKDMEPLILFVKGGYEQALGNDFTLTGAAGVAKHNFYPGIKEEAYSQLHTIYSLELAKQWHIGRLFVGANNTGQTFFLNIGCKVIIQN